LWSPDSNAFAINQTVGGGGIGQRVYVYYLGAGGLRKLDVSAAIERKVGRSRGCEVPVYPNTAAIEWFSPSKLLVAVETAPVSICRCYGAFVAYAVSMPDLSVGRKYSQEETKKVFWEALGCQLRRSRDCS
jgi:hypothetical protein